MKTLNRRNRAFRNLITWDTDREELEQRLVPATITVVNTNDSGPGSLRAAITTAASQSGEDTIQFDTVLFSIDKTITLASPLVVLDSSRVVICGPNTSVLTLYGNNNTGILKNNSDLILSDMVFSNGTGAGTFQSDNDYPNIRIAGGALYNTGSLSATNITIANSAANYGGGIFNTGDIKLQNSLVVNNAAITRVAMGGGIYNRGRMTIVQSTISKNGMSDGGSAGIYNAGLLTLVDSTVTENGKQYYDSSFGKFIQFNGGGIRIGSGNFNIVDWSSVKTTIINTTISNNLGGGIAVNNVFTDDLNIINSTISNNKNLGWAAIVGYGSRGNGITMINTICADNINYDLDPDGPIPNLPFPSDISYINFGLDSKNNLVGANDKRYPAQGLTNGLNGNYLGTSNNPISANISSLGFFGGATQSVIPSSSSIATHSGSDITKLSSSLNSSSNTLSVFNAKILAVTNNSNSIIRIGDEQLRIQAVDLTNNLLTVIRGINGTTATSHNISDQIYLATDQRGYQIFERPNIGSTTRSDSNMTITPSKSSTIHGESVSFTIHVGSVTSAAGMPTGTLQLMDGSASLGNGTIDSSGNISFPISVLSGGSHAITASYNGDWRFNASSTSITYIVNRASSTSNLTNSTSTSTYGDTVTFTTIVSSTAAGNSVPSGTVQYYANMTLIGTSILDTNGVSRFSINNRSVGNHTISSRYLGDINYSDSKSTSDILLTVTPAPLNLSIDNKIKTYGANNPTLTYTFSGLVAGDNVSVITGNLSTSGLSNSSVGNYPITPGTLSAGTNYNVTFTNGTLSVVSANLTVTGSNITNQYGNNLPLLTYSYSGLVAGDTSSVFSGSLSTSATIDSPVGVYPINQGSLTAGPNYEINYTNGNLTVTPAALSVTISSTSKLYGAGLPNFSFNYSGFLNGDAPSLFSGSLTTTATANSPVGTFPISVGTLSAGPNYAIVPTNGTLIINPASLAVTGSNQSKSYGANLPDLKYSYSGLVNGDTESVFSGNLTTTATANSPVGSYPITVGSLAAGSNYNIAFTNGTLSVTSSSLLVVTATNKTKVYGDILPTLSYTYSGLINGDTSAVFTGNLMTTATSESAVGIYGITQGNLSAGSNYAITFNNGTLTATPATINVTASNSTKSYGGAIPALNYSYSGLVNGDTSSIFTGELSTSASTSSGVGNYNITQGSLSAGNNYSIIYTNGTLSVTPANLSVSANNLTKTFGAAIPPLTYVYTGLVNNDSSSVFRGNLVTSATSSSVVANYPITRGNLSAGNNYNISFVNGTLSVIKSGSSTSISAPSTAVAGTNVTISASVTATAPGAGIPTGSVQFYDATTLIGTVSVNSNAQASIVTGSLSLGNHTLSAIYVGDSSFNTSTSGSANITIQAGTLSIQSFSSDASAVTVKFNQAIATSSLQINDAYTGNILTEVADLTVTDRNGQSVKGSMIVASDAKSVTFIKTGVAFANGTYTVRLRSGSNAFRNTSGEFLDGNNDGVAGGDYVTTFAVTNSSRVLSIPDVVRGPGQAVRVNTTDLGVPVKVNDGTDIFAFEVSVNYDPALMSVTDVVVPSNLSSFLQISYNSSVAGRIDVVGIAVNGLPGGSQNLFYVNGTVPNGVLYRSKAELTLSDVNLYKLDNSTISTTLDQGVQLVSYIGDVTGDGRYNALDPLRIQRYLVNLDRWFAQFPLVDPLLVADVTGDGKVNALDALYMQRYLVNLSVPYLSAPPVTSVTQSGLDPIIRLPKNLSAMRGQVVQVPVELQNTDSQAINVNSFEVAVQIDPHAFRLMKIKSSDKIRTNYDDVRGILIIAGILPEVTLQPGESMIICSLQIKISAHTKATDYVLNLLEDVTFGRAHYATSVNGGTLKLVPAPTNESNDSVDGNIRILERPNRFVSRETFRKSPILKKPRFGFIAR